MGANRSYKIGRARLFGGRTSFIVPNTIRRSPAPLSSSGEFQRHRKHPRAFVLAVVVQKIEDARGVFLRNGGRNLFERNPIQPVVSSKAMNVIIFVGHIYPNQRQPSQSAYSCHNEGL